MAKTPNDTPAEPDTRTAIVDECERALKKLGGEPDLMSRTGANGPDELHEALRKHGAKPDLLKIIESWRETMDDRWVLNELRRWNTRAH
jgi:hypothetical protein